MSGEGGFNLSIGGDVKGDAAQTIDKSTHQTTNVAGDVHGGIVNTQGIAEDSDWSDVEAEISEMFGEDTDNPAHSQCLDAVELVRVESESEEPMTGERERGLVLALNKLKQFAPLSLRIAAKVIEKGAAGGSAEILKMIADRIEK